MSTGHANFLEYNALTNTLSIYSVNDNDIGSVDVTVEAYLEKYPNVKETFTFKATVTTCEV